MDDHGSPRTEGGGSAVTHMLRTAQQHHAQISMMADAKANILVTVSSIILTLTLTRLNVPVLRPGLLVLAGSTLIAFVLAVIAIIPRLEHVEVRDPLPPEFNILFFGHFSYLSRERFLREIERVTADDHAANLAQAHDLYSLGTYLFHRKFRYLRFSYWVLLGGFVTATVVQIVAMVLDR
ncbi:MAG TPA: Pycsar system effector family protein [Thermoanaerobaculia bacterium]|nr:Pycsar system effector family protein [Thermoanaerobaculia bacterium]